MPLQVGLSVYRNVTLAMIPVNVQIQKKKGEKMPVMHSFIHIAFYIIFSCAFYGLSDMPSLVSVSKLIYSPDAYII